MVDVFPTSAQEKGPFFVHCLLPQLICLHAHLRVRKGQRHAPPSKLRDDPHFKKKMCGKRKNPVEALNLFTWIVDHSINHT